MHQNWRLSDAAHDIRLLITTVVREGSTGGRAKGEDGRRSRWVVARPGMNELAAKLGTYRPGPRRSRIFLTTVPGEKPRATADALKTGEGLDLTADR